MLYHRALSLTTLVFVVVVCLSVVCLNSGHASLYSHQKHKSESGFLLLSRPYQRISLWPIDYHHSTKSVFLVLLKEAKPLEREPSKPGKYFHSCGRRQRTGKTHPGDRGLSSKRSFAQHSSRVTVRPFPSSWQTCRAHWMLMPG